MSRDITLFNDNGTAYMISAADENYDLQIYRLTADYRSIASLVGNFWNDGHREAPALFKRGGTYFMLTSGATGWNPNQAQYATASSIAGPWTGWTNVGDSTTYNSQTAYVLPVQGTSHDQLPLHGRPLGRRLGRAGQRLPVRLAADRLPDRHHDEPDAGHRRSPSTRRPARSPAAAATYYRIANRNSGKVMDVVGSRPPPTTPRSSQYTWNGGGNQKWGFQDAGGGYCAHRQPEQRQVPRRRVGAPPPTAPTSSSTPAAAAPTSSGSGSPPAATSSSGPAQRQVPGRAGRHRGRRRHPAVHLRQRHQPAVVPHPGVTAFQTRPESLSRARSSGRPVMPSLV